MNMSVKSGEAQTPEYHELVSVGGYAPPKRFKQKVDKKAGEPFGRLQAARRVKAMDGLNQSLLRIN